MTVKRAGLQVGAGRAIIRIPEVLLPLEGFTGVHDDLHVRVLLLSNGLQNFAMVVVELTSLGNDFVEEVRHLVQSETMLDYAEIFVCASHTFQAPHLRPSHIKLSASEAEKNALFKQALVAAVKSAVSQAHAGMQDAKLGFGTGQCNVNVNRDVLTDRGWWKGTNVHGPSDKTVAVIRFDNLAGQPIALFVNYPVQSGIMLDSVQTDGQKLISADLGGYTARYLERQYNDKIVALWNVGAAGDQDPLFIAKRHVLNRRGEYGRVDVHEAGWILVELLGERLGQAALAVAESITKFKSDVVFKNVHKVVACPGQEIFPNVHEMEPRKEYEFKKTKPFEVPVHIMILGDIALIGVRPELVCTTALEIKEASPYKNTVIMTMVNGSAKYLPDAKSYEKITYAAMNSMGAKGAAELLRDEIIELLDEIVFA